MHHRIEQTESFNYCEIVEYWDTVDEPADEVDLVTVCLTRDDVAAARAFGELKAIAVDYGLRLYDPQVGDDVDLKETRLLPEMY